MRKLLAVALASLALASCNQGGTPGAAPVSAGAKIARGNPTGEWRYWGADAWSSRYSALDQINASNFNSLQVAWQWAPGGTDEYFRSTPLYANGVLYSVGKQERHAFAIDPATGKQLWE